MTGIPDITPDSLSYGILCIEMDAAVAQAQRMRDEGADALDIGGESTRPTPGAPARR